MFKKKVLATSWHPGGANAIVPVIKKLQSDGKVNITVLGHQYSEAIYKAAGIPYNTLRTYGLKDVSEGSMAAILAQEIPDLVLTGTSVQDEENRDVIEQTITLAARKRTTREGNEAQRRRTSEGKEAQRRRTSETQNSSRVLASLGPF